MPVVHVAAAAVSLGLMLAVAAGPAAAGERLPPASPAAYRIGPPAPDCHALAASHGAQRLWFGAISGMRINQFFDVSYPHYAEGCFLSERDCRRWLHEHLSFMDGGSLNWMRCQPAVPARAIY